MKKLFERISLWVCVCFAEFELSGSWRNEDPALGISRFLVNMVIDLNLVKLEKKEPHGEIGWLLFDVLLHLLVVKNAAELLRGFQYHWHLCVVVERRKSLVSWEAQQSWAGFACGCCRAANATDLVHKYTTYLTRKQDELLNNFFKKSSSNSSSRPSYTKLYSYHHVVNGFAVELTAEEVSRCGVCLLHSFFLGSSRVFFLAFFRPSCNDKKVEMYAVKNKLAWVDEEQYCINKLQAWMGRWGAMYKILVLSSTRQSKPHLRFVGGFCGMIIVMETSRQSSLPRILGWYKLRRATECKRPQFTHPIIFNYHKGFGLRKGDILEQVRILW